MTAFIDSVGSGSAAAVPDVITLDVSARAIGPTVAEALAGSDAAARRIIDAATDAGLPARDRQTTGGRVVPVYDREGRPTTDFQATTSLRLRVRQPDRAGTLITTLAEVAGDHFILENLASTISDDLHLAEQAREDAFRDARARASQWASLAHLTLGQAHTVIESGGAPGGRRQGGFLRAAAKEYAGTPVESGECVIPTSVSIRWDVGTTLPPMDAFVEMTGTGTASAAPDVVALDLGVRCPGDTVATALGEADDKMAAIVAAARDAGVAGRDLQTTGASVYPQYDNQGVKVVGYIAGQSLRLRVRDRDQVGPLITAFSTAAGNSLTIDNIAVQLSEPGTLLSTARDNAFADAKAKAHQYAVLAGRELGKVVFLIDSPSGGPVVPMASMRMDQAMAVAGGMPVEAGENSVTASVVVRWAWA